MSGHYLWLIIGMAAVTYLPRLLPLTILTGIRLPLSLQRFLSYLPYAALGALLAPGAWQAIPQQPAAGFLGVLAAAITAWLGGNLMLAVTAGVLTTFFLIQ
ncbi:MULTISPECIES: AzlD domain-containing protein [unclassified Carboxydocella]|uniref:AzlD domain-containing protein n=1 Tax=unclassified Carboxydocella TaxID=2685367 RepID=UPI0009ACBE4F|nr:MULTISPECIES: AzlD domain-containing protein [unclassified Carboxydocella]GAW30119.1 hypothetical protein ULO1_26890 [Carboxydocella sp. ULO1]GAW31139.1 hypothetical protein JDF658_09040 [Carboxydocella sp. JDF658]